VGVRGGNIAYGTGAALGGLYGGVVNDTIGWRWAFALQVSLWHLGWRQPSLTNAMDPRRRCLEFLRLPLRQDSDQEDRRLPPQACGLPRSSQPGPVSDVVPAGAQHWWNIGSMDASTGADRSAAERVIPRRVHIHGDVHRKGAGNTA